jgi:predicted metal-binding protein
MPVGIFAPYKALFDGGNALTQRDKLLPWSALFTDHQGGTVISARGPKKLLSIFLARLPDWPADGRILVIGPID